MTDLNCYIATFNCGRTPIDVDIFAANFSNGLTTNLPPDLIVLSLQEIAPIGYSFLGGSLHTPYFSRFGTAVNVAASQKFGDGKEYDNVFVKEVGMTGIMLFARPEIGERIKWIETAGVGVGLWAMGNKGACAIRIALNVDGGSHVMMVTFAAAHLSPMEWGFKRRNQDWQAICEGLVFEKDESLQRRKRAKPSAIDEDDTQPLLPSSEEESSSEAHSLFSPMSHVFFAGDLNYRTSDVAPDPEDHKTWPEPVETPSNERQWSALLKQDQLTREHRLKKTLHYLAESEITFPPTYKYSTAAQKRAQHLQGKKPAVSDEDAGPWAKHRIPSWCDRILYLSAAPPAVHAYTALPLQPTSDHRPVVMSLSIPLKPLDLSSADVKPPFPVRKDWREARAAARRFEFVVGLLAYVGLTWEGEALLAGTIIGILGGYLALRALIAT